jgi:restriction endonuclease S subunit
MIRTSLGSCANLRSGCHAKLQPHGGDAIYIQIKDFDETRTLNNNKVPEVKLESNLYKHILKKGDILFAAKGTNNFAVIYHGSKYPALASTSFIVIDAYGIDTYFLEWYLNRDKSLGIFKNIAKGSGIPSIPVGYLQGFQIPIPPNETIEKILKIVELSEIKIKKQTRLNELNYQNIQNHISSIID